MARLLANLPRGQETLEQANGKTGCGGASAEQTAEEGKGQMLLTNHNLDPVSGKEMSLWGTTLQCFIPAR